MSQKHHNSFPGWSLAASLASSSHSLGLPPERRLIKETRGCTREGTTAGSCCPKKKSNHGFSWKCFKKRLSTRTLSDSTLRVQARGVCVVLEPVLEGRVRIGSTDSGPGPPTARWRKQATGWRAGRLATRSPSHLAGHRGQGDGPGGGGAPSRSRAPPTTPPQSISARLGRDPRPQAHRGISPDSVCKGLGSFASAAAGPRSERPTVRGDRGGGAPKALWAPERGGKRKKKSRTQSIG